MSRILFLLLVFLFNNSSFTQESKKQHLDSILTTLEDDNTIMGSMFVSKNNIQAYSKSIGYNSIESNIKSTEETKYRIGSITKMFTSVMIFQLIDTNKLDLDSKLSEFYPTIKNADKITIGNLLNHRSGVFNFTNLENFNPYVKKSKQLILLEIEKFTPVFEPNTKTEYSNTNYILLGYILEEIHQKSYAKILQNTIVDKLSLKNTYYGDSINIKNNEAESYVFDKNWIKSNETHMSLPHGAGAIVSTPKELTIFMNALMGEKLVSKKSLHKMKTTTNGLGYGIAEFKIYDRILYGHNGGIDGFKSLLIYDPKENISVAFTSNSSKIGLKKIVVDGLETFMSIPYEKTKEMEVNSDYLNTYAGVYKSEKAPFTLTFYIKENTLFGGPTGNHHNLLLPSKENQFKLESEGTIIDFDPKTNSLVLSINDMKLPFSKQ